MTPRQLIDRLLGDSGWGTLAELEAKRWIDCQPDFDTAHYTKGFAWPDGKFRFKPDWKTVPFRSPWLAGPVDDHAGAARPLGGDRGGDGGVSVPARDLAGAQFPQLDLQRDADVDSRARIARP